jgi:plasmid stability protein
VDAEEVVDATVEKLRDAGAPTEVRVAALRGAFGRTKLRPVGEVWRLGALCLADDGTVFATGDVLVVTRPTHPNHRSAAALARNELRAVLLRAGVPEGATAVIDARPLDLDAADPPLVALDDGLGVLWTPGGAAVPFAAYLAERADLLLHPPAGATD